MCAKKGGDPRRRFLDIKKTRCVCVQTPTTRRWEGE